MGKAGRKPVTPRKRIPHPRVSHSLLEERRQERAEEARKKAEERDRKQARARARQQGDNGGGGAAAAAGGDALAEEDDSPEGDETPAEQPPRTTPASAMPDGRKFEDATRVAGRKHSDGELDGGGMGAAPSAAKKACSAASRTRSVSASCLSTDVTKAASLSSSSSITSSSAWDRPLYASPANVPAPEEKKLSCSSSTAGEESLVDSSSRPSSSSSADANAGDGESSSSSFSSPASPYPTSLLASVKKEMIPPPAPRTKLSQVRDRLRDKLDAKLGEEKLAAVAAANPDDYQVRISLELKDDVEELDRMAKSGVRSKEHRDAVEFSEMLHDIFVNPGIPDMTKATMESSLLSAMAPLSLPECPKALLRQGLIMVPSSRVQDLSDGEFRCVPLGDSRPPPGSKEDAIMHLPYKVAKIWLKDMVGRGLMRHKKAKRVRKCQDDSPPPSSATTASGGVAAEDPSVTVLEMMVAISGIGSARSASAADSEEYQSCGTTTPEDIGLNDKLMMDKMLKELNTAFSLGYNVGVFKVEAEERLWVEQNQAKVLQVLASHLDDRRAKNASAAYRHLQPICRAVAEAESPTGGGFGVTKEEDVKKEVEEDKMTTAAGNKALEQGAALATAAKKGRQRKRKQSGAGGGGGLDERTPVIGTLVKEGKILAAREQLQPQKSNMETKESKDRRISELQRTVEGMREEFNLWLEQETKELRAALAGKEQELQDLKDKHFQFVQQSKVDLREASEKASEAEKESVHFREMAERGRTDKKEIQRIKSSVGEVEARAARAEREKEGLQRALDELRRGESDHIRENDVAVLQLKKDLLRSDHDRSISACNSEMRATEEYVRAFQAFLASAPASAGVPQTTRQLLEAHLALCRQHFRACQDFRHGCEGRFRKLLQEFEGESGDEGSEAGAGRASSSSSPTRRMNMEFNLRRPVLPQGTVASFMPELVAAFGKFFPQPPQQQQQQAPPPGFGQVGGGGSDNSISQSTRDNIATYVAEMKSLAGRLVEGTSMAPTDTAGGDPVKAGREPIDPTRTRYKALIDQVRRALPALTPKECLSYLIRVRTHHGGSLSGLTVPYIIREVARRLPPPPQEDGQQDIYYLSRMAGEPKEGETVEEEVTRILVQKVMRERAEKQQPQPRPQSNSAPDQGSNPRPPPPPPLNPRPGQTLRPPAPRPAPAPAPPPSRSFVRPQQQQGQLRVSPDRPNNECSICLDTMWALRGEQNEGDEVVSGGITRLGCRHAFHTDCIKNWLREKRDCPLCRNLTLLKDEYPALGCR